MDTTLQIRDYFYGGFNKFCLDNYDKIQSQEKKEIEEYIYQIYMIKNIKNDLILSLNNPNNSNLYLLYLYYKYYYLCDKENVLEEISKLKTTSQNANILKSRLLFDNDKVEECFDLLEEGSIELNAAKVFMLLNIWRNDIVYNIMNNYFFKMNEDIPIVKIVLAIFYLYNNNNKESFLIFDDLESLYTPMLNDSSNIIWNGKGVSNLLAHEYNDAKEFLTNALKNSDISYPDAIYNLITCSLYLCELEEADDYLNKLYSSYPPHDSLSVLKNIDYEIDNFVPDF
ncbi:coatomer subunit epsilon, putative [Plasmodium chabaudi chabaudi]|uniref:Coatomer subunit epsilon, putative n=1 Tax=Plasmodium chabaudi chabaudi TaxID=31271 RepID=A0A077TS02_PLACU|nr:coatomer subunit epsilon, putative [Plasmodium chabaudi chabaudi]SCM24837.1 coatomer subunit epsilon, putative [Plasmodium chabaudi chabaudi]SCN62108.1 coatomer subunit epsilon, putative [Plasmodium chabaudi chabaudi]VTZ69701.1 coatomer subunit epsilon, putative [Plasmodium chabaudi chabaudi]|eukprot:XP_016654260.1 coatomer epsilon subunit, putative [Plasmodium chabaudi chabaudi]